jgi:hypothetical protein
MLWKSSRKIDLVDSLQDFEPILWKMIVRFLRFSQSYGEYQAVPPEHRRRYLTDLKRKEEH